MWRKILTLMFIFSIVLSSTCFAVNENVWTYAASNNSGEDVYYNPDRIEINYNSNVIYLPLLKHKIKDSTYKYETLKVYAPLSKHPTYTYVDNWYIVDKLTRLTKNQGNHGAYTKQCNTEISSSSTVGLLLEDIRGIYSNGSYKLDKAPDYNDYTWIYSNSKNGLYLMSVTSINHEKEQVRAKILRWSQYKNRCILYDLICDYSKQKINVEKQILYRITSGRYVISHGKDHYKFTENDETQAIAKFLVKYL